MILKMKKGRHYHSGLWIKLKWLINWKDWIAFEVTFPDTAWYPDDETTTEDNDMNKLFGFGGLFHHKNSARFNWLPDYKKKGHFKIFTYVYENGKWERRLVKTIAAGRRYRMRIRAVDGGYQFQIGDQTFKVVASKPNPTWKVLLLHHGGDPVAPKTYYVELNKVKKWN